MKRARKAKFTATTNRPALLPLNERQADLIEALWTSPVVIVMGPSGTGKTYVPATYAADRLYSRDITRIVLTRPNVASGRSIGFFPGSLEEKMGPWLTPVIEPLNERLGKATVELAFKSGNIEIVPFETMRGRSFKDSFVILDEAQNTTPEELKMFLTRQGENTQVVLNGDIGQSDLKATSGLAKVIHMVKRYQLPVPIIEFGIRDIVRSDMCRVWIEAFMKEGM